MKPIAPTPHAGAAPLVFAVNQPEYDPVPAAMDMTGLVLTEWELSAEDLAKVLNGGRVRLWIWTFRHPLQPVRLEVVE